MPGCIVSATTASFRSVEKRRRRATPVMTSTFETVSDIGVCLGLYLGPPAKAGVRSKQGAVQRPQSSHRYDLLLGRTGQQSAPSMAASGARPEAANFNMGFRSAPFSADAIGRQAWCLSSQLDGPLQHSLPDGSIVSQ